MSIKQINQFPKRQITTQLNEIKIEKQGYIVSVKFPI